MKQSLASLLTVGGIAICFAFAFAVSQSGLTGKQAPTISGATVQAKTFSLANAQTKGPVLVYFISTTCPVTDAAAKYMERTRAGFANTKLTVVGVTNANKSETLKWLNSHKIKFDAIPDAARKIIDAYDVHSAPTAFLISKSGKVLKAWDGYSQGFLKEAAEMASQQLGIKAPAIDFSGAPKDVQAG